MEKIEKVTTITSDDIGSFGWIDRADKLPVFVRVISTKEIYLIAQAAYNKFAPIGLATRNRYCEARSAPALVEYLEGDDDIEYLDPKQVVITVSEPID